MITFNLDTAAELAEAIYYAHAAAEQIRLASPSAMPRLPEWEELSADSRGLWITTAERLIALAR
jgi:hypothetical protein